MITFNDIFKNSFLENMTSFSFLDMAIAMALAFAVGLFIMMVYQKTFKGVMYSRTFCVSLLAMTLITTLIILAVTSNVVLSLGMVGALSIVRFRSAVKEPLDIAFIFWSISVGIVLGAGLSPLAVIGSAFIGIVLLVFVNKDIKEQPYIMIISAEDENAERRAVDFSASHLKKSMVKSKTVSASGVELTMEVRLAGDTSFINSLSQIEGIKNAVLVSYNGEYMG